MHLVALVQSPDHVCCRYRIEAFRPRLEHAGHTLDIRSLPRRWWSRLKLFHELRGSTVILQRWLIPGWQLKYLRSQVAHLIFDFDDAVYLRDSYSKKGHEHPRNHRRFQQTIAACDAVAAGNMELAAQAKKVVHDSRVHIIPTCVDLRKYPRNTGIPSDDQELVWIGSSSTLQGIEAIAPLLERLGARMPGLRMKIICDRFPSFQNLQIIPRQWQDATEVEELSSSAIGFSWIPDDPWSRGKCGLKVLQYMAAGLPVLANPVGVQNEMVRPRENGFLVRNDEECFQALVQLQRTNGLRKQMGESGRSLVENRYSVETGAGLWLNLLKKLETSSIHSRAG